MMALVSAAWIYAQMNRLEPSTPWRFSYGEIASAIADASNAHPIFPGEEGPKKTASILIAIARYESTFNPNALGDIDENGKAHSFGLFQIQVPTANMSANLLLVPRDAAVVAINLIETSFKVCSAAPWDERLGWYAAGGPRCKESGREKSKVRLQLAEQIFQNEDST